MSRAKEGPVLAQATQEQETTVTVSRGLFLLRYASGAANGPSPYAVVRPNPASAPFIEVISAPGIVAGFLSAPGDCAVVRAEQAGGLVIKIVTQGKGDPLDASFKLEPLTGVEPALLKAAAAPAPQAAPSPLSILAHVSRRGDVEAPVGAWIAGPEAPAAIEGLEIRGTLPAGLSLDVQPLLATRPPRWLDWSAAGKFIGTRQRALPLAGLRMRLSGPAAETYEIAASALFLGSPVVNRRGRDIEIVSAAGVDPLVGLRFELISGAPERAAAKTEAAGGAFAPPQPKLRVFRASAS
jgi:hypothetical protein